MTFFESIFAHARDYLNNSASDTIGRLLFFEEASVQLSKNPDFEARFASALKAADEEPYLSSDGE